VVQLQQLFPYVDLLCFFDYQADRFFHCLWVGRAKQNILNLVRDLLNVFRIDFAHGVNFLFFREEEVSFVDNYALQLGQVQDRLS
jgi:hypothetical protein